MSPRKSSTSSGNPSPRPRYLGVEVVGVPTFSPRGLERELARSLAEAIRAPADLKLIRFSGPRVLVRVTNRTMIAARTAWNGPLSGPSGEGIRVATRRTFGTLRKGKEWLGGRAPSGSRPALSRETGAARTRRDD